MDFLVVLPAVFEPMNLFAIVVGCALVWLVRG